MLWPDAILHICHDLALGIDHDDGVGRHQTEEEDERYDYMNDCERNVYHHTAPLAIDFA